MKRITKCILVLLICVAAACCAAAAGCTLSNAKIYLEGDEGITFNEDYVEQYGEDGKIFITASRDTTFHVGSIPSKCYTIEPGYELAGWTLYIDGEEYEIPEDESPLAFEFQVDLKTEYILHANIESANTIGITLQGGDGITINESTLKATLDEPFSIDSQVPYTAYTVWDDYDFNGWILLVDGVETTMENDSFTPEAGHTYVLKADVTAPVYATVQLKGYTDDEGNAIVTILDGYTEVQVKVGTTFQIHISMYTLDSEYVIDSWTLTKDGEEVGETIYDDKIEITEAGTYTLTPTTAQKTISINISNDVPHVTFSETSIGAHNGYVLALSTVEDMATLDTGYEITGWTMTVNDSTTTIDGDTYTVGTTTDTTYTLTPVLSQYYYVSISTVGIDNSDKITIGAILGDYTGALKFYVGEEYQYALPTEDASYIHLEETYGIKDWSVYDEDGNLVVSLSTTSLLSLTAYGNYILVPNVQFYYTVDLAEGVNDFEMEQIRVYTGDDFITPAADASIISNDTGRDVISWHLEDEEGTPVTLSGGADGLSKCSTNVGEISGNLVIYPVLSDATYSTWVNEVWLNQRAEGGAQVSDHGGTVLGTDSNSDVWHNISDYYTYDKTDNIVIYTLYNTSSTTNEKDALPEGFWFRTNTSATDAGVTLTEGNYYDLSYSLINYGNVAITLSVYTCSNGFMGSSGSAQTESYASTQHITIAAGTTYNFTQLGWYENKTTSGENGDNNFITIFQLDTAVAATDSFVLGIRIGIAEHTGTESGTLYIDDSVEGFTLSGTWTSETDSKWKSTSVQYGNTVSLSGSSSSDTNTLYVEYTIATGYTLTGWKVTYTDGTTTTYLYTIYDDTHTGANAFTFTDQVMYLTPVLSGSSS